MICKLKLLLVCITVSCSTALAATLNVGPGQTYATIQSAINAANAGDTVVVYPGTYTENIDFKGKSITVTSSGSSQTLTTTILDGGNLAPTVTFQSGESRMSVLSWLTIRNGANGGIGYGVLDGGVAIQNASPTILNNVITSNHAHNVRINGGAPLVQGNRIFDTINDSGLPLEGGDNIFVEGTASSCTSAPSTINCPFLVANGIYRSSSANVGPGIGIDGSDNVYIEQNTIHGNTGRDGGGIYFENSTKVVIVGNLIYGNTATNQDGGIHLEPPQFMVGPFTGIIANNTIADNLAPNAASYQASQMSVTYNVSVFVFVNNIIEANSASPAMLCTVPIAGTVPASFDHNDIYNSGGPAMSGCDLPAGQYGNISADPLFFNAAVGAYTLKSGSPASDAGNTSAPILTATDEGGSVRVLDGTHKGYAIVDIGAYENNSGVVTSGPQMPPQQTTITVTPSAYIQYTTPIQLTAQLASPLGVPTGSVTFLFDNTAAGMASLDANGQAQFNTVGLAVGTHTVTAQYAGTSTFSPAVSVKFYVQIATAISSATTNTMLSCSPNPATVNQQISALATVTSGSGTPTGGILFTIDGNPTSQNALSQGSVQVFTSFGTSGLHTILATYVPTGNFAASSAQCQVQVNPQAPQPTQLTLTSNLNPAYAGQPVTFTMQLTVHGQPAPAGSTITLAYDPQFTAMSQLLATLTTDANGMASFTTSSLPVGTDPIVADFAGTPSLLPSSVSLNEVILPSTFTIALQPATITLGPGQAGSTLIALTSVGGFNGPLTLSYGALPQYATATISPSSVTLSAGGTGSATLVLKTLLTAAADTPPRPGARELPAVLAAGLALLLPLCGARRRRLRQTLCMLVAAMLLLTPVGCTNAYYAAKHVAPGTYPVPVTATDIHGNSQSATLTLMVTP